MANSTFEYLELRFVIEPDWTVVHVLCGPASDGMLGVQGWHTKRFPKDVPVDQLVSRMFGLEDRDDPVLWPHEAPGQVIRVSPGPVRLGVGAG